MPHECLKYLDLIFELYRGKIVLILMISLLQLFQSTCTFYRLYERHPSLFPCLIIWSLNTCHSLW